MINKIVQMGALNCFEELILENNCHLNVLNRLVPRHKEKNNSSMRCCSTLAAWTLIRLFVEMLRFFF